MHEIHAWYVWMKITRLEIKWKLDLCKDLVYGFDENNAFIILMEAGFMRGVLEK